MTARRSPLLLAASFAAAAVGACIPDVVPSESQGGGGTTGTRVAGSTVAGTGGQASSSRATTSVSSGGATTGGSGGSSASGGQGGGGASGVGAGGGGPLQCQSACSAASYCNTDTGTCDPCADLSRLRFGLPFELVGVNDGPGAGDFTFPRIPADAPASGTMIYTYNDTVNGNGLNLALSPTSDGRMVGMPMPVNSPTDDAAAIPIPGSTTDFLFDHFDPTSGHFQIMTGSAFSAASAPLQGFPFDSSVDNMRPATSRSTARLWWVKLGAGLVTAAPGDASAVTVALALPGGCDAGSTDVEPWVTPDGTTLFFASVRSNGVCSPPGDDGKRHIFSVPLGSGGQVSAPVVELADLSLLEVDDHSPSLSPDQCALLFTSTRTIDNGGVRIFQANRN